MNEIKFFTIICVNNRNECSNVFYIASLVLTNYGFKSNQSTSLTTINKAIYISWSIIILSYKSWNLHYNWTCCNQTNYFTVSFNISTAHLYLIYFFSSKIECFEFRIISRRSKHVFIWRPSNIFSWISHFVSHFESSQHIRTFPHPNLCQPVELIWNIPNIFNCFSVKRFTLVFIVPMNQLDSSNYSFKFCKFYYSVCRKFFFINWYCFK